MILIKLNAVQVLALSCVGVTAGVFVRRRLKFLDALNVPASIVGGLLLALLAFALRERVANFELDLSLRDLLMVGFFTTIGMGASLRLLRRGGVQVVWFLVLATIGAVLQNAVGAGLAHALGLSPLLGVVSGSVSLTGGPATAIAFGGTFEQSGVVGATTLGVASAMFGITAGGLLGGFIGGRLVRRHHLHGAGSGARITLGHPGDLRRADPPGDRARRAARAVAARSTASSRWRRRWGSAPSSRSGCSARGSRCPRTSARCSSPR